MADDLGIDIRTRLVKRREHLGLSQLQLAERMGVSPATISHMENGIRGTRVAMVRRWVEALELRLTLDIGEPDG